MRRLSRRDLLRAGGIGLAGVVGAALIGCGGDGGGATDGATDGATTGATTGQREPVLVSVALSEFAITSSRTVFEAGVPYRFVVKNEGAIPHEFMIMPPMEGKQSGLSMKELDEMALAVIGEEDLPSGATAAVLVTFPTATTAEQVFEASCHLPGHYEAGMRTELRVN